MSGAVERVLRAAGVRRRVASAKDLSGGCIHAVSRVTLDDGTRLVVKTSAGALGMFEGEAAGLRALAATGTVLVPEVIAVAADGDLAGIVMTALEPGPVTEESWRRFGADLAALHAAPPADARAGYGFATDNHLGTTPQPNGWCDDWVRFNAERRLGHQLALAQRAERLTAGELRRVREVIARLDRLVPARPRPSLLHGDLWSGNALPATGQRVAVIDPACSYGDGWADIAMMKLFGGFPQACFDEYGRAVDDHDRVETRLAVYQLYHVLNHVNLFGRGYAGQAMALVGSLLGANRD